jgi:hypothetical protein
MLAGARQPGCALSAHHTVITAEHADLRQIFTEIFTAHGLYGFGGTSLPAIFSIYLSHTLKSSAKTV